MHQVYLKCSCNETLKLFCFYHKLVGRYEFVVYIYFSPGMEAVSIPHIELWYDIGFYLGVKIPYLEDLKGLPSGQMNRIMRGWLGGDKNMFDYFMEPCWKTLVKAIAHPAGGNNASLAEEIALSHLAPADARFIGMLCFCCV